MIQTGQLKMWRVGNKVNLVIINCNKSTEIATKLISNVTG